MEPVSHSRKTLWTLIVLVLVAAVLYGVIRITDQKNSAMDLQNVEPWQYSEPALEVGTDEQSIVDESAAIRADLEAVGIDGTADAL